MITYKKFTFKKLGFLRTLLLFLFTICSLNITAQQVNNNTPNAAGDVQKTTGKVVDSATGEALPFVSIVIANTTNGATTDDKGSFTLNAAPGSELIVSYIGYTTKNVTVGPATDIIIKLGRKSNTLEQVVVVGYGTQRKRDITTAVSSIGGGELAKQPVMLATEGAQGKAAGVQIVDNGTPGTAPTVLIRGTGTILGGSRVLYVVDGTLTQDIANINPADILTMDILKDASATAIYGSRGANGVIIITTKKGTAGKMKVEYDVNVGYKSPENLVKMANAAEYANYYAAASSQPVPAGTTSTDWYSQILKNVWQQQHNLSVSGGSDQVNYFLSFGYFDDAGTVINNDYKRYTLRSNTEYKLNKNIKLGIDASYTNADNQAVDITSAYNDAYRAAPIIPAIIDGKYGNTSSYGNVGNPILDLKQNNNKILTNRLQAAGYLDVRIIKGLTFRSNIGVDYYTINNRLYNYRFENNDSFFLSTGGNQRNPSSSLNMNDSTAFSYIWDNTLTYNKTIGKHSFTVLAGVSSEQFKGTSIVAYRKNVAPDPSLWYIFLGDANTSQNNGFVDFYRRQSYFGRLNYNYDGRFLFAATLREDGSTRLPVQNRWQYYPSASAGWIITQEKFMQHQHIADYLKLRVGYGKVGNDQLPTTAYTNSITYNQAYPYSGGTASNGAQLQRVRDENLNWETTEEYDAGLEFSTLKQRLTGEVSYYNKKVLNLLEDVIVSGTVADQLHKVYNNIGNVQNKGWEITLKWADNITKDLSYHIGGNITFNQNKVLSLNGGEAVYDGFIGANQGYVTKTDNGLPIGSFYVLKTLGVFQNQAQIDNYKNKAGQVIQPNASPGDFIYQDTNGDGKIDDNDRVYAGSYQPKAYYGINLGVNYKKFDFSIDFYGNAGNKVYNGKKAVRQTITDNVEESMAFGRWTPGSGINNEPSANGGNMPASTYFVENGSFFRINNVTIGYTLPTTLFRRLKLNTFRVYVTAQNLYTFKKYTGFTPELPGSSPTYAGIELNAYPTSRIIAGGLNIGF